MGPAGKRTLIALLMVVGLWQSANAASDTVGGSTGWNLGISSTFYDDWAKSINFLVGDTLVFDYTGTTHNVFEVSQADLASCNTANPIQTYETSGGASVPITTAGNHYYICGVPGHCAGNMKMTISVAAAATAPASPPTPAPVTPPTPAPVTPPTPAPATTTPAPAPATTSPAPAPAASTPSPTPTPAPASKAPAPAKRSPTPAPSSVTPSGSAPAPAPSGSTPTGGASSLSRTPAMIVGAVLCIAMSFLFH